MGSAAGELAPPAPHQVAIVTVSCPEEVDHLLAIQAANAPEALTPEERASQGCVNGARELVGLPRTYKGVI